MSKTGRVFEHYLITGLHVTKEGWNKSWKDLAHEGARAKGVDEDRASASVKLIKQSTQNKISNWEAQARRYIRENCHIWTDVRTNSNGGRISGSEYLLDPRILVEFEEDMTRFEEGFWDTLNTELFQNWEQICSDAVTDLNDNFQKYFIPLEELREKFSWNCWIKPLWDIEDMIAMRRNEKDSRLIASQEVIERAMKQESAMQAQKISNVVGSIADSVMSEVHGIVDKIDAYTFNEGDNRKGNSLPKQKGWERLEEIANRIDTWTQALADEDLTDAANQIRELVADIKHLGNGSLADARNILSGEDDTQRREVRDKLSDIHKAAAPAADKLSDFLS